MYRIEFKNTVLKVDNLYLTYYISFLLQEFLNDKNKFYEYVYNNFYLNEKEKFDILYSNALTSNFFIIGNNPVDFTIAFLNFLVQLRVIYSYLYLSDNIENPNFILFLIDTFYLDKKNYYLFTDFILIKNTKIELFKEIDLRDLKKGFIDIKKFNENSFHFMDYIGEDLYLCLRTDLKKLQIKMITK